jgi:hypothetical protein
MLSQMKLKMKNKSKIMYNTLIKKIQNIKQIDLVIV